MSSSVNDFLIFANGGRKRWCPKLNSANIDFDSQRHLGKAEVVGPILTEMNRPVSVLERDCLIRTVVNMAEITVVHAQEMTVVPTT